MLGKVGPEKLKSQIFNRLGAVRDDVEVGPGYGEDTAAIDLGDQFLVVNTDPIIYAADMIGVLGINVASNDIAASGAEPGWLTVIYLLPETEEDLLGKIAEQVDRTARDLGISVVGGHSEYISGIERPILALSCFGLTENYIPTGGAKPGEKVLLTKGAGIEGTGILATDFKDRLQGQVEQEHLTRGCKRLEQLSVLPEALILRDYASSMHDPTEGGIINGLFELSAASGFEIEVKRSEIIVHSDTRELTAALGIDPLKIFASGSLVSTVPQDKVDEVLEVLRNEGISANVIGKVTCNETSKLRVGNEVFFEPITDQLYDLWD